MDATPAGTGRDDLSQVRHDLKTPLNHILGYSEMLEEEAAESGQTKFIPDLKRIQQAARNLAGQIERFFSPAGPLSAAGSSDRLPRQAEEEPAAEPAIPRRSSAPGHVLVVDDNRTNRELLARRLARQGYTCALAENGREGLEKLRRESFDLVLLDIIMPEMDGYAALEQLKADKDLRHIPVIMISALDQLKSVVRCIEIGAEDYLPKPFNPTLLQARIGACLEKKRLRDQERRTYLALVESQQRLAAELAEAAAYVKSILPAPLDEPAVATDWRFLPSTQIGGDAFGYHWLDEFHFAMFVLDVSGHGVGAALLSVSAVNVLRSQTLPVNFRDPGAVLGAMNNAFQMERQNNMFFTLWYGVFDRRNRELRFANAGHPPAVLFPPSPDAGAGAARLTAPGMIAGCFPSQAYAALSVEIPPASRLYLFSDGAYEIAGPDGGIWGLEALIQQLRLAQLDPAGRVEQVFARVCDQRGAGELQDDVCILEITLP